MRTRDCYCLLPVVLLAGASGTAWAATKRGEAPVAWERFARQVVALTNAQRAAKGLPPLKLQDNLTAAARWLAQDMADRDYFDHTDRQGRSIDPRLPNFGYGGYQEIGENIAAGQATPADAVSDWMRSPDHRENLLSANYSEIGIGYIYRPGSAYRHYWVQDFGSRNDVFPVVINEEAPETSSENVRLYIYGKGWARQMRLSNDGIDWTPWERYHPRRDWTLAPGSGKHTVYVEVSDGEITRRSEDSIDLLEDSAPAYRAPQESAPPQDSGSQWTTHDDGRDTPSTDGSASGDRADGKPQENGRLQATAWTTPHNGSGNDLHERGAEAPQFRLPTPKYHRKVAPSGQTYFLTTLAGAFFPRQRTGGASTFSRLPFPAAGTAPASALLPFTGLPLWRGLFQRLAFIGFIPQHGKRPSPHNDSLYPHVRDPRPLRRRDRKRVPQWLFSGEGKKGFRA